MTCTFCFNPISPLVKTRREKKVFPFSDFQTHQPGLQISVIQRTGGGGSLSSQACGASSQEPEPPGGHWDGLRKITKNDPPLFKPSSIRIDLKST